MNNPLTPKQQYWSDQLQKAESSGLSLAAYAREHNIPLAKLYQWRSTLRQKQSPAPEELSFAQVVSTVSPSAPLSIQLGHAQLQFGVLPEPEWILSLLERAHSR